MRPGLGNGPQRLVHVHHDGVHLSGNVVECVRGHILSDDAHFFALNGRLTVVGAQELGNVLFRKSARVRIEIHTENVVKRLSHCREQSKPSATSEVKKKGVRKFESDGIVQNFPKLADSAG